MRHLIDSLFSRKAIQISRGSADSTCQYRFGRCAILTTALKRRLQGSAEPPPTPPLHSLQQERAEALPMRSPPDAPSLPSFVFLIPPPLPSSFLLPSFPPSHPQGTITPLFLAALNGHEQAARLLLESNADTAACNAVRAEDGRDRRPPTGGSHCCWLRNEADGTPPPHKHTHLAAVRRRISERSRRGREEG